MDHPLSRAMSAATASYAVFCFARPEHLGRGLKAGKHEQAGYDQLALVFGVRDLAVSAFGLLGRSEQTVRTAMWIRIACDVGDGLVLASRASDPQVRTKALAVTTTWGALNLLALRVDRRRAAKKAERALSSVIA